MTKPLAEFGRNRERKDGLMSWCRPCWNRRCSEVQRARKEAKAVYDREYRARTAERKRANDRAYYQANRERVTETNRIWREAHPDIVRLSGSAAAARRRARMNGNPVEPYRRQDIYARDGGVCYLCGVHIPEAEFTIDHLLPVSRGCADAPSNVAVAHMACNRRKWHRTPAEYFAEEA